MNLPDAETAWNGMGHKASWVAGFHAGVEAAANVVLAELDLPTSDPAAESEVAA